MNKTELRKLIIEEILVKEKFETLSDILKKIDLESFKKFFKNKKYDIKDLNVVVTSIKNWGKLTNKNFDKYKDKDLRKIGEYMQDLVLK